MTGAVDTLESLGQQQQRHQIVIPIHGDSSSCQCEWTAIELNGELILPAEMPTTGNQEVLCGPDQIELGSLRFDDDGKTPIMVLGSHELRGTLEHLKQPFCVFEKHGGEKHDNEADMRTEDGENHNETDNLVYNVVGIVTKKLLFNNYPKTIMK